MQPAQVVRVRFAPSPTGFLHIGGARTALFNWMYAKAQGGKFVLRIEDTDMVRSKPEYLEEILDSMKWLGLTWDEYYKQSDRFELYRQYADKLLSEGKAYKDGEAVILKVIEKPIKIYDLIRGEIVVDSKEIKDQVLMKSDGSPTYSFACVIDDALMEISCVIRGEDHISNTPKQILIYEALGFKLPKFAHLPLILDPEGGRMSKRAGATAVTEYRTQGYLSQAIVNYLMLLGWSPGNNQEKILMASALKTFSIKKVNKAGAAFSLEKLQWINSQYIKEMGAAQLAGLLRPLVAEKYPQANIQEKDLEQMAQLYKGRMNTLLDFLDWTDFIFNDQVRFEEDVKAKHLSQNMRKEFDLLADRLSAVSDFNVKATEEAFRGVVAQLGIEAGVLVHPVRVALTGKAVGPGLFDTMALLGRERTIRRLKEAFS
jgi:glutamyl-tRNA synthetase